MLQSPLSPKQLVHFQEIHYSQRIIEAKNAKEIRWLKNQLECILNVNDTSEIDRANRNLSIQFKNNLNLNK